MQDVIRKVINDKEVQDIPLIYIMRIITSVARAEREITDERIGEKS